MTSLIRSVCGAPAAPREELQLFVFGARGVGKSALVARIAQRPAPVPQCESTFGYELSALTCGGARSVRVHEFAELCPANAPLVGSLICANAARACVVIAFDCRRIADARNDIDAFFRPLCEHCLVRIDAADTAAYQKYLGTLFADAQMEIPAAANNVGMPLFLVGTFPEALEAADREQFDARLRSVREAALSYGAGVALASAPSLAEVLIACAERTPLPYALRSRIAAHNDFFIPPAWDSAAKLSAIETPADAEDPKIPHCETKTAKSAPKLKTFLSALSERPRAPSASPDTADFLARFE